MKIYLSRRNNDELVQAITDSDRVANDLSEKLGLVRVPYPRYVLHKAIFKMDMAVRRLTKIVGSWS